MIIDVSPPLKHTASIMYKPLLWCFITAGLAVVRFRTERYGGHVAMHCHVNSHSDTGVMAVVNVIGGEGPNEDPTALAAGTCG